jgi:MFS family permease
VPRLVRTVTAAEAEEDGTWSPRADLLHEVPDGPGRFTAAAGPFATYLRTVAPDDDGTITEVVQYRLAPLVGVTPYGPLLRRALRRPPRPRSPWWAPPEVVDARAATVLAALCGLAIVVGYLGTVLTQTITFAGDELGVRSGGQSAVLAVVRVGVLATLVLTALADRHGRRRMLLGAASVACVATALGALAPNLATLAGAQLVVRALVATATVVLAVIAVEEMPAGARAFGISLLGLCGALGVGICSMALPLADLGTRGWRLVSVVPLAGLPLIAAVGRHLPESRRFEASHHAVAMAGHGRRLLLLCSTAFLLAVFSTPASQLMNEFLRDERGFSASRITLFTILTKTPGFLGVVAGGRIADVHGRRIVGASAVVGGALLTAWMVLSRGWSMWALSLIGAIVSAAALPALGVYGPELFPTSLRGRANGVITVAGVLGTAGGLLTAGYLTDRWGGLGRPLLLLCAGPVLMAALILAFYPETSRQQLEELNPEDPRLAGAFGAIPGGPPTR